MSSLDRREVCFICQKAEGDVLTVQQRGVKTLLNSAIQRKISTHRRFLNNLSEVKVHSACQKNYNNPKLISAYLKRGPEPSTSSTLRSTVKQFDLKNNCFYCGEKSGDDWVAKQRKLPIDKQNSIHKVMKLELKESVIQAAERRGDNWASEVVKRINDQDLVAKDAWYHRFCQRDFYRPVTVKGCLLYTSRCV